MSLFLHQSIYRFIDTNIRFPIRYGVSCLFHIDFHIFTLKGGVIGKRSGLFLKSENFFFFSLFLSYFLIDISSYYLHYLKMVSNKHVLLQDNYTPLRFMNICNF